MEKLLFDGNFNHNKLIEQIHACLFAACAKIMPTLDFDGFSTQACNSFFSENVYLHNANIGFENIFNNIAIPFIAMLNKNTPFYFPVGNIPGFLPDSLRTILMIKNILPLELPQNEACLKEYKRQTQTDINRADTVFVLNEYANQKLMKEFMFFKEPIVLGFASIISDKHLELPLARNNEKYFFVEAEHTSPKGLGELLKIFIYSNMTQKNKTKLYISGNINMLNKELMINLEVARKVGAIREYKNLSIGQKASMLRGAIAALLPSKFDVVPISHLDAMKCSCPIITDSTQSVQEVCQDAAIYANISDTQNYNNLLQRIQTDEAFRMEYISKGMLRSSIYSWDTPAQVFLKNIGALATAAV